MAKNTDILPYTEQVERIREIARISSDNDRSRARGAANDIYTRKLPSEEDWIFFLTSSAITCSPAISTGLASVNTQDSVVSFSGVDIDTTMSGRKIKFTQNSDVYTLTVTNTSTGTISPVLSGDQNLTSAAFTIFSPVYALPGDFDRFPKNGGLTFYQGGQITQIPEVRETPYFRDYVSTPTSIPRQCRLVQSGTDGLQRVEIQPPPLTAYNLPYEYLRRPVQMRETTAGTATVSAAGTSVTFHAGARLSEATTGMYFRVDAFGTGADSEWFRVIAISQANSTCTLQTAFSVSGAVSAGYTLCSAPEIPVKLHPAIMFGAVTMITADQNDQLFQLYQSQYRDTINDGKRTFKSRVYNQEVDLIFEDWQFRR